MKPLLFLCSFLLSPLAMADGLISGPSIESGSIVLSAGNCPSGFTEYTASRGMFIVGVPSGGTIAGTVGSAMTNLQNITHTHTVSSTTATNASVIGSGVYVSNIVGNTGTAATGSIAPYIQMRLCSKD